MKRSAFELRARRRRGMTLVELLVVIGILMMLAAIIVPNAQPALEGSRVRESARMINAYLGSARSRAMETGRPCGVIFRPLELRPEDSTTAGTFIPCCTVLEQAEVPPTYCGNVDGATAVVGSDRAQAGDGRTTAAATLSNCRQDMLHEGDLIRFNNQGPYYEITAFAAQGGGIEVNLLVDLREGGMLPWPSMSDRDQCPPVSYEIYRRPVKSFASPLQLPSGAVIDLQFSGCMESEAHVWGYRDDGTIAREPIIVMFSPSGSLDRAYHHGEIHMIGDPICLLVGQREKVPVDGSALREVDLGDLPSKDDWPNWLMMEKNLWVTLNPGTGQVTTAEIAPYGFADGTPPTWTEYAMPINFMGSRYFAVQAQTKGGL